MTAAPNFYRQYAILWAVESISKYPLNNPKQLKNPKLLLKTQATSTSSQNHAD